MIRLWLTLLLALAFGRTTFAHCVGVADVEVLPAPQILEGDPVTIEVLIVTCSYPASLYQPTELTIDGQTILIDIYAEGGMADTADWILEPVPLGPLKSGVYSYTIVTHRIPEQGGGSDIFEDTFCVDTAKCGFLPCKCRPIVPTYAITKLDTLGGTGGVALAFGSAPALVTMVDQTARGEGFGAELGLGSRRLCDKYGHPEFSMAVKGQEFPGY
ncbi:MAG: hypothetical protein IIB61_05225, partial [Planctomycetes bacterium]|nr:hypothetical protein [Planctomycetota bacterium]